MSDYSVNIACPSCQAQITIALEANVAVASDGTASSPSLNPKERLTPPGEVPVEDSE